MILDNIISYNQKIFLSMLCGAIWIYFRNIQSYILLPNYSIISIILVTIWIYFNYQDPLFLPIGLSIMYIYSIL